jgi:GT2 family glycosyltransferase
MFSNCPMSTAGASSVPLVAVLILNFCSMDDTLACVESVRATTYPNVRMLVIDNNSPDGSGKKLATIIPSSEFVQLPENTGYAGGNNFGIRLALDAGADYILVLNPDIRLLPHTINDYVEILERHRDIGALNSVQVEADGITIDRRFNGRILRRAGNVASKMCDTALTEMIDVDTLFGAALMLSRHAIECVGGFDPLYFAYGEEKDLCQRLRYHRFRLVVTRKSPVIHLRTSYQHGISPRVAFLRLKGFYLSEMKNPFDSFVTAYARAMGDFCMAFIGRPPKRYPFTSVRITRIQLAHAVWWFSVNGLSAWRHKQAEKERRMHV